LSSIRHFQLLDRIAMRPILLQMLHVAWSVCLSVWHDRELCKNSRTNRDAVLGADLRWPWEPGRPIRRVRDPHAKGQFWCDVDVNYLQMAACTLWAQCSPASNARSGRVHSPSRGVATRPVPKLFWAILFINFSTHRYPDCLERQQ